MASKIKSVIVFIPGRKEPITKDAGTGICTDIFVTHDGQNRGLKVCYSDGTEELFYNIPFTVSVFNETTKPHEK